jgi:hypothetical protein
MSRKLDRIAADRQLDKKRLEESGYKQCPACNKLLPVTVSRCRRRTCPGYSATWARDTRRKIRENLRTYGGLACMSTLTAPGVDAGLVWDRTLCTHPASVKCSGLLGCKVVAEAADAWNEGSKAWWRELNRVAKQRADKAVRQLGHEYRGGVLAYQWEMHKRGVWHLHFVLGMETAVERAWAFAYVAALHELGRSKGFGNVDRKPLHAPQSAERTASYISKYLVKWHEDGSSEATETVLAAGRSLLNYVSRRLTAESGVTMRVLRQVRIAWAWREGLLPDDVLDPFELLFALCLLEQWSASTRGP